MIPGFHESGNLPPGIHITTLEEVAARFGQSTEVRRAQVESLRWLVELAQRAGAKRLIVNGSFVTEVEEPNDVDCVLLIDASFPKDTGAEWELLHGLPFLQIDLVEDEGFRDLVERVYASDRDQVAKGMIEVVLWN